jgi:hypothetical protein
MQKQKVLRPLGVDSYQLERLPLQQRAYRCCLKRDA